MNPYPERKTSKRIDFFTNLKNYLYCRKLPLLITIAYTTIVLVVLLQRFWQYEVFYYDHGYTESAAYQAAQRSTFIKSILI